MSILSGVSIKVGPNPTPLAGQTQPRSGSFAETVVSQAHGKYHEAAVRGSLFCAANAVTGSAILTGLAAVPPILLSNPIGSGKKLSIKKVAVVYVSGTMGAGGFWHALMQNLAAAPVVGAGAAITIVCLGGLGAGSTVAKAFTTPTQPATAVPLWPLASSFAELATTANGFQTIYEDVDGAIVLSPSDSYEVAYVGSAGTSPVIACAIVYEELPIV